MLQKILLFCVIVLGLTAPSMAQQSTKYQEISKHYTASATQALSTGDMALAQEHFERALVADPSNITAMIGMGKAHEGVGRTGKGLRFYRLALDMEPNYKPALAAQSLAFLKVNEADRASANLTILERLCADGCVERSEVEKALEQYSAKLASSQPPVEG